MEKEKFVFIIDNGHGFNTKGKRSPDGSLLEWKYTREIAAEVVRRLRNLGYNAIQLTPENYDVKLEWQEYKSYDENMGDVPWKGKKLIRDRVGRVKDICNVYGTNGAVVCSIHCNAAGNDGKWKNATGWSVFVSANHSGRVSNRSDLLARIFTNTASLSGVKVRIPEPAVPYWVKSLAITRDTPCPAVLTENMFMDNESDCAWLLSYEGKEKIVQIHVDALVKYYKRQYGNEE